MNWLKGLILLASLSLTLVTGCAMTSTTGTTDSCVPCPSLEPITYSYSNDTNASIRQIREYNAIYQEICKE